MKTKISIISLLLIFIMPIHSIALDVGVPIKIDTESGGLITITKLKDLGNLGIYMYPSCSRGSIDIEGEFKFISNDEYRHGVYDSAFSCTTRTTTYTSGDYIDATGDLLAKYLIESDSVLTIEVMDFSGEYYLEDMSIVVKSYTFRIFCTDEDGDVIANGLNDLRLYFDKYSQANCYLYFASMNLSYINRDVFEEDVGSINITIPITFIY